MWRCLCTVCKNKAMGGERVAGKEPLCAVHTSHKPIPVHVSIPSHSAYTFTQAALHALAAVYGADRVDSVIRATTGTCSGTGEGEAAAAVDSGRHATGHEDNMGDVTARSAAAMETDDSAEQRLQRWTFEAARSAAGGPTLAVE